MRSTTDTLRAQVAAARHDGAQAVAAWRRSDAHRTMVAAFAACGENDAEPAIGRVEALLRDQCWVTALLGPLVAALRADPFFEPPFRVSRDAARIAVSIHDSPGVSLAASVASAAAVRTLPRLRSVVFSGRRAITRVVRAGGGTMARWQVARMGEFFTAASASPCTPLPPHQLVEGAVERVDGREEARLLVAAKSDVVTLTATLRAGSEPLLREYAAINGALLRLAPADGRASRTELLLALLRASGRADAGTCFADATRSDAFHLRWSAMRQWLALDAEAALPRLAEMARDDANAEVRSAAASALAIVKRRIADARCHA